MDRLHVATLNIRNLADRWFERLPLLLADMATLQPDVLGLQEVVYVMQQDRVIGAAGEGHYGAVRGDAARLGQVVVNLVHNAVKFSPDGGDVTVVARAVDSDVVVSIADQGVGIPRAAQPRIFERFYKVDRARFRGGTGGTGLGLAISRHIVEQHGGRIWVASTDGAGSTFSFAVPAADPGTLPAGTASAVTSEMAG